MKKLLFVFAVLALVGLSVAGTVVSVDWQVASTSPTTWQWNPVSGAKDYLVLVWRDTLSAPVSYTVQAKSDYSLTDSGQTVLLGQGELTDYAGRLAISVVARFDGEGSFMLGVTSVESKRIWAPSTSQLAAVDRGSYSPEQLFLKQNYPNPFNPTTTINYELAKKSQVRLVVYNLRGEVVTTLVDAEQQAGNHNTTWNATNVPSGVYLCRMQAGDYIATKKMTLMK